MKSTNRRVTRPAVVITVAAAALLLSSCGSKSLSGVAADVDGTVITDKQVDEFATLLCSLQVSESGEGTAVGSRQMRVQSLDLLLDMEVARQIGDFDEVDPALVAEQLQQAESARGTLPEDQRALFDETVTDYAKAQLALIDAGRASLEAKGETAADDNAAFAEADRIRTEYLASVDISVDPRFGVMDNGALTYDNASVSTPVSTFAKQSDTDVAAPDFVATLPANQICS